jgi:hypothetical protein
MSMDYSRQRTLELEKFDKIMVVGVGGIGSWVALDLALSGQVRTICVCDNDVIEESNLNRTPYRTDQIGESKVWAIKDLIDERRNDVNVVPVDGFLQTAGKLVARYRNVIDCTDGLSVKDWAGKMDLDMYAKLGYDGFGVTIDCTTKMPWGTSTGYDTVPSFIATPQFISSMVVGMILSGREFGGITTFDMRDVLGIVQAHDDLI